MLDRLGKKGMVENSKSNDRMKPLPYACEQLNRQIG